MIAYSWMYIIQMKSRRASISSSITKGIPSMEEGMSTMTNGSTIITEKKVFLKEVMTSIFR